MLATKSDDLNSIALTHMLEEETDSEKLFSAMECVPPSTHDKKMFILF